MGKKVVVCDTNIMIEFFRGNEDTIKTMKVIGFKNIALTSITIMEMYQGIPNKQKLDKVAQALLPYKVIHFNRTVSKLAINYMKRYHLSHHLQIPDAIIAASVVTYNLKLFTYNKKDFSYIPNIQLYKADLSH